MESSLAEFALIQSESRDEKYYSLRWNNHQSHILSAFSALLQAEALVDVTLVCAEISVRAHKVVLSACSPFFHHIFSENPCKHPIIVLKDFYGWEIQAIVDFMYRGEISVRQERLQALLKAGESLQVRGLVQASDIQCPLASENEHESFSGSPSTNRSLDTSSPDLMKAKEFVPTLPRRKQARPIRRSGGSVQDTPHSETTNLNQQSHDITLNAPANNLEHFPYINIEDAEPEDLCIKKSEDCKDEQIVVRPDLMKQEQNQINHVQQGMNLKDVRSLKAMSNKCRTTDQELDLSSNFSHNFIMPPLGHDLGLRQGNYLSSLPSTGINTGGQLVSSIRRGSPPLQLHHHSAPAFNLTPPHMFRFNPPAGPFPTGIDPGKLYSPLLNLDLQGQQEGSLDNNQSYSKRKRRPKGQYSSVRGGPPRSWTNAELTEALQHVWNKRMTTSQASRIFGIPYNSLLMYVRGKYGKSLKLEQLRKDCTDGAPLELPTSTSNNNNNGGKGLKEEPDQCSRLSSSEPDALCSPGPVINPFSSGFYPKLVNGSGFSGLPFRMLHSLPSDHNDRMLQPGREALPGLDEEIKNDEFSKGSEMDVKNYSRDERHELIQHNGQD